MKSKIKKYNLFFLVVLVDLILWFYWPDKGTTAVISTGDYLVEMLLFIPPIFILIGLLDVWVPREIVEKNVGSESGVKGVVISILVATAAAGPLYAGFPVAYTLMEKGCRMANVVIFLGTWATIKVPMLMMEIKFLGMEFAAARLLLTLPAIILSGYLVERLLAGAKKAGKPKANKLTG
ncbi:MAG: permease [Firmicutes bacterium]|nr:permease [Bacillota bacterium]